MAGLAERRGSGNADSFWTSARDACIASSVVDAADDASGRRQATWRCSKAGFTRVGEFHYLRHDPAGQPYTDVAEMARRIVAAAATPGCGFTVLPVFYAHSRWRPAAEREHDDCRASSRYSRLMELTRKAARTTGGRPWLALRLIVCVRSRRKSRRRFSRSLEAGRGIFTRLSRCVRFEDCQAWSGQRPVEPLWARRLWTVAECLIHSTHVNADETHQLASGRGGLVPDH